MSRAAIVAAAVGLADLSGCASSGTSPVAAPAGAVAPAVDWHALMPAPFGTLLKDMPVGLTEVLQFDADAEGRRSEPSDCFTTTGSSLPTLVGRRVDDYLLCFEHDRLSRVEASVRLPAAGAEAVLAAACSASRGGREAARCEGRDGATQFSAVLTPADAGAATPEPLATLSITLEAPP
jgi:hypothetical protein